MPNAVITNSVIARDHKGRFLARYEEKKLHALEQIAREGMEIARGLVPKKTGHTAATMHYTVGTSGASWSVGGAGLFQEYGTPRHDITGWVSFFWEREGRPWVPGMNTIDHPGNRATHFMLRSYEAVKPTIMERIRTA